MAKGTLIHADETKGVVKGGGHYMWVFANLTTVAYVYSESREASILEELLAGFSGVLVSDFYAAYDSVPCPQALTGKLDAKAGVCLDALST